MKHRFCPHDKEILWAGKVGFCFKDSTILRKAGELQRETAGSQRRTIMNRCLPVDSKGGVVWRINKALEDLESHLGTSTNMVSMSTEWETDK